MQHVGETAWATETAREMDEGPQSMKGGFATEKWQTMKAGEKVTKRECESLVAWRAYEPCELPRRQSDWWLEVSWEFEGGER